MPTVNEARRCFCVLRVGARGPINPFWQELKFRLWFKFFPWFARNWKYSGWFCMANQCMYWYWIDRHHIEGDCAAKRNAPAVAGYVTEHGGPPPVR